MLEEEYTGLMEVAPETQDIVVQPDAQVVKERMNMMEMMKMADMLANSTIVPISYQHRPENCYIALDMASRMGVSVMMIMQNLSIIQGKPSFSGQACSALLKASPNHSNIKLHFIGTENKDDWGAYVTATDLKTGEEIKGGTVTIAIAKKEGWYQKAGSKWQTMPEIMLAYRAYTWFIRVHAPYLLMGLQTNDEVEDILGQATTKQGVKNPYEK